MGDYCQQLQLRENVQLCTKLNVPTSPVFRLGLVTDVLVLNEELDRTVSKRHGFQMEGQSYAKLRKSQTTYRHGGGDKATR